MNGHDVDALLTHLRRHREDRQARAAYRRATELPTPRDEDREHPITDTVARRLREEGL